MGARIRLVLLAVVAGLLAWELGQPTPETNRSGVAQARSKPRPASASNLWATINKCDTPTAQNTVGVRGSMPGLEDGRRATASMRFRIQYRRGSDGRWASAGDQADSGWVLLGPIRTAVVQAGHDFKFEPPAGGGRYTLRGVVQFRWGRGSQTVRTLRRVTTSGHPSSAGADPAGYSAGTCVIR